MADDLYRELGLDRNAGEADIKKAYRRLAKQYHPDRNRNNPAAEEKFKKVSAAYAVLSDARKKELYDRYGIDGLRDGFDPDKWQRAAAGGDNPFGGVDFGGFSGFGGMEDIFETLFGGSPGRRRGQSRTSFRHTPPGADIRTTLEIELLDAVVGRELDIAIPVDGERRQLKVKVPAGVESGQTIRLKEQGARSPVGGKSGDLLLNIRIREEGPLRRQGMDLVTEQTVTIGQAWHGDTIEVATPWGSGRLKIPAGTQGGARMRIRGHGVRRGSEKGDLIVQIQLRIPTRRSDETSALIDKLEKQY